MNNYFAKNIIYLRKRKNMSRQELADKLDVGLSTVACWENGLRTPNMEMLANIINIFDVKTDIVTRDITSECELTNLNKNDNSELDQILFSKMKELSEEDKKTVLSVVNAIHKDIDKELDNQ